MQTKLQLRLICPKINKHFAEKSNEFILKRSPFPRNGNQAEQLSTQLCNFNAAVGCLLKILPVL